MLSQQHRSVPTQISGTRAVDPMAHVWPESEFSGPPWISRKPSGGLRIGRRCCPRTRRPRRKSGNGIAGSSRSARRHPRRDPRVFRTVRTGRRERSRICRRSATPPE